MLMVLPYSSEAFARAEAGGKGFNLYLMTRHGLPVPSWVVLGKRFYAAYITEQRLESQIQALIMRFIAEGLPAVEASRQITSLITQQPIPVWLREAVEHAWATLDHPTEVAIRSSAADEDSAGNSFAGQLSSFLYIRNADEAVAALLQCWASAFSERALVYRKERGLAFDAIAVAVIIQEMIDPDAAGVLFTCDPLAKTDEQYLISAVYGVGEGLVSGALDADTYWLDATTGALARSEVVSKAHAIRRGDGGSVQVPVASTQCDAPVLNAMALAQLHTLGRTLDAVYHYPQDVEWAIHEDKVSLLQTRPVTTLDTNLRGYPNLWDNSNIVESYGGITLPLSFTFALNNYHQVYVQFCEILGVPHDVVKDMDYYLRNMLGCINGRVFYNLYNWYKLVGVLPGFKHNRQFMETMMGVREALPDEISERIKPHPSWNTWRGKLRRLRTGLAFVYYHFAIQGIVDRFLAEFRIQYDTFRSQNYRRMPSDQIFQQYVAMDRAMLSRWQAPIINDFLAMVHFGLLKRLTDTWLSDLDVNAQNDLLAGEGNLESTEPTRALITLAAQANVIPELRSLLLDTPPADAYEVLCQSSHSEFLTAINHYIDCFGFRCMNEMKLEEIDLFTDPTFLFTCLNNYLRQGITDQNTYEVRNHDLRRQAESSVVAHLSPLRRLIYYWALKHARKSIRNRENTRFARTRAYGIARSMFQAMGDDLTAHGVLDAPSDIFYLEMNELYGIHQGTLTIDNLRKVVELRRQIYAGYEQQEPQTRFLTRGPVYWENSYLHTPELPAVEAGATYHLKGLPCCPGIVEGIVHVVINPGSDLRLQGEILVTPRTDPGWVPLYPSCSGLLVERGSLLSHSAIVAREMGLPTIVGIRGLTQTLKTGMRIRMDGKTGTIVILDE